MAEGKGISLHDPASAILSRSFVVCAALAVVAGCALVYGARHIVASDKLERRDYEGIGRLEESRASMRSGVSNMRAYMLSLDPNMQQASLADVDDVRDDLNQFSDASGESAQLVKLEGTVNEAAQAMGNAMAERSETGPANAAKVADDPALTAVLADVDSGIGNLLTEQSDLVDVGREKRQDDFLLTEIAFFATLVFGSLALVLAAICLKQEGMNRQFAEAQHANAKQDLLTIQAMMDLNDQRDELTGLLNREAFSQILEQEYDKNRKSRFALSLVVVDLDQLSHVRESRGTRACDEVMKRAAALLKESFRNGDVCCRFGDAEFAIILPRTNLQNATVAAERARSMIEQTEWPECNITASFGVAQADYLKDRMELIARAEQAVDYARRTGRNRVTAIRSYLPLSA